MFVPVHRWGKPGTSRTEVTCPRPPDGKVLAFSVLILNYTSPGWLLPCDSYPPGGSKGTPSSSPSPEVGDLARFLDSSCPLRGQGHLSRLSASLSGSDPLVVWFPKDQGQEIWLWDQTTHLSIPGLQGWPSRKPSRPPPLFCVYLLNFYCELILKGEKYLVNLK
jgi:hypothetical protein